MSRKHETPLGQFGAAVLEVRPTVRRPLEFLQQGGSATGRLRPRWDVLPEGVVHIVEIKRKGELGLDVAHQIEQKVKRLPVRSGVSVRTALVYDGRLTRDLQTSDSIDCFVSARMLLGLE